MYSAFTHINAHMTRTGDQLIEDIGMARSILIRTPNWVGDCVMATAALQAFRAGFPNAHITLLTRPYAAEIFEGGPWFDEIFLLPSRKRGATLRDALSAAGALRHKHADLGILLTNSFAGAVFMRLASPRETLGYAREGRGWLLTRSVPPPRVDGAFLPAAMTEYYLDLARAIGCPTRGSRISLVATDRNEKEADVVWRDHGFGSRPVIGLNPGAAFGSAKCWPPDYFTELALLCGRQRDVDILVLCGPGERDVAKQIVELADDPAVKGCHYDDISLGTLKVIIRRLALLVTNDSGPRHFACAFDVPTVTLFGPTDQRWSDTGRRDEIQIVRDVACRPCMLRVCPTDHACMRSIHPQHVLEAVLGLLGDTADGGRRFWDNSSSDTLSSSTSSTVTGEEGK